MLIVLNKLVWSDCFAFLNKSEFYRDFSPLYGGGRTGVLLCGDFCYFLFVCFPD